VAGLPVTALTVMSTSWYGLVPAATEMVVGKVISAGIV
jgi:hypothetical protein